MGLMLRMYLVMAAFFGVIYVLVTMVGWMLGAGSFLLYGGLAVALMGIQFVVGPRIVEWSMKVRYVNRGEAPELHQMVEELAGKAGIPKPRVGVSPSGIPNAFAFGRGRGSSSVCVTRGLLGILGKEELRGVLGHEISHIRNRDVAVITLVSVVPTIAWYIAWSTMFSGGRDRGNAALLGAAAFGIYFITNLLVLYLSRIREYYADRGSVALGSRPHELASALYKLVYGGAKAGKEELKGVEGMKAFFASDPSRAMKELGDLKALDADLSGHIDREELEAVRGKKPRLSGADRLFEAMSTHPNMLKRVAALAEA